MLKKILLFCICLCFKFSYAEKVHFYEYFINGINTTRDEANFDTEIDISF